MKRGLFIILLLSLFFGLAGSVLAFPTMVEEYPKLPACEKNTECRPGEPGFGLAEYIKYIFIFALGIVGIVGLLALILASLDYIASVGNPQKASEAKDKIISAILGLLLLLGSYVLLNLINPDLLKMKKDLVEPLPLEEKGKAYECYCCCTYWPLKTNCAPKTVIACLTPRANETRWDISKQCAGGCEFTCSARNNPLIGYRYTLKKVESCK